MKTENRRLLILLLGAAVMFALFPGGRDLWNPNEPIYGQAVREMIEADAWLIPTVNGLVFSEKPVLYYWMARVTSILPGGPSEGNLRLPSAIAALVSTGLLYLLVLPYAGHRRALWAGALFATTFAAFWGARTIQMDILVLAGTLAVLVPLTRVADHGMPPMKGWILAGIAAGLGFMGKGPVAWVLPALVFCSYAALTGRVRMLWSRNVAAGAAAAILVTAPWHLAVLLSGQGDILVEMYYRQNVTRFHSPWDHQAPWWYFLKYFWIDMAPWAFLVPLAAFLPGRNREERRLDLLAWIWILGVIAFFSLSESKRSAYIMPIAPAVACLASGVVLRLAAGRLPVWRKRAALMVFLAYGAVLTLGGAAVAWKVVPDHPELRAAGYALAAVMSAGGLGILLALVSGRRCVAAPKVLAAAVAACFLTAICLAAPAVNPQKSARVFSDRVNELAGPGGELYSYGFWDWRSGYAFYTGRKITNLKSGGELEELWREDRPVFLIVEGLRVEEARRILGGEEPVLVREIGSRTAYLFENGAARREN